MIDRIQLILKSKNLSPSQFADEIQVQRSSISHILSGRNKPSLDFIMKILSTYQEVNSDWLIFGKGQMVKKEKQGTEFVEQINPDLQPTEIKKNVLAEKEASPPVEKLIHDTGSEILVDKILIFYKNGTYKELIPK